MTNFAPVGTSFVTALEAKARYFPNLVRPLTALKASGRKLKPSPKLLHNGSGRARRGYLMFSSCYHAVKCVDVTDR